MAFNRRQHRRIQSPPVSYRPPTQSRFQKVLDISAGGMRVLAPDCLEAGERLPLELMMPDGASIELWAEVAWTEPGSDDQTGCESGLRFTDIPDYHRLRLASLQPLPAGADRYTNLAP
jgi:c-di-GMP-binding flagellar brake protein YcgR